MVYNLLLKEHSIIKEKRRKKAVAISSQSIVLVAFMIATLVGAKFAIAIPNVEIVTLLLSTYAIAYGVRKTLIASFSFILIEILIFGFFPTWVFLYFIYWPMLVLIMGSLRLIKKKKKLRLVLAVIFAVALTAFFSVLSTLIEISFMGALESGQFWTWFVIRYANGVAFFVTHIVANAIIIPIALPPLTILLERGFRKIK